MTKHICIQCEKECPCDCFEVDSDIGCFYFCSKICYDISNKTNQWDADFGEYEGHYFTCEFGGKFEEKWKQAVKSLNIYQQQAERYCRELHEAKSKKKRSAINFSSKYSKLDLDEYTTIRWNDFDVDIGKCYDVFLVAQNNFHTHYGKGKVRVMKLELKKIKDITDDFIKADADCDRKNFMSLMQGWYGKKHDWKAEDSEVLIIYLKRVKQVRMIPSSVLTMAELELINDED
jgi:hypothetical protein